MQYTDEFLALTQIGIALTGFMGIVITLRTGSLSALGAVTRARVQDLLILPLGVMFFALAPSIIAGFLANGEAAWRSAMFLWALYVVFATSQYFVATGFKQAKRWEIITLAFAVLIVLAMFATALGFYVEFIEEVYFLSLVWMLFIAVLDFAELLFADKQSAEPPADSAT